MARRSLYDAMMERGFKNAKDAEANKQSKVRYMLARTNMMFEYEGLPDSIPKQNLEMMLQTWGHVGIPTQKINGSFYAFCGNLGGEQDPYYLPSKEIIANPALDYFEKLEIDQDVVIVRNDTLFQGLMPLHTLYADLLAENERRLRQCMIYSAYTWAFNASTDQQAERARLLIQDLEEGKPAVILGGSSDINKSFQGVLEVLPIASTGSNNLLKTYLEAEQFLKGQWFNELGLNSLFNMKREAINEAEASMGEGTLLPLVDDMLLNRQVAFDKLRELTNGELDVTVRLASAWEDLQEEVNTDPEEPENEGGEEDDGQAEDTAGSSEP